MAALTVLAAGPACTIQDAGRGGFLRYGVTPAGPMDWIAHAEANLLAGQPAGAGAIEIGPGGITLAASGGAVRVGWSARGFLVSRDGTPLPACAAVTLQPGSALRVAPGESHLWAYLAVGGGLDLDPVMGSLATHQRTALGPLGGGALVAGLAVPVCAATPALALDVALPSDARLPSVLRFIPGPQQEAFTDRGLADLVAASWVVAPRSDRMAYRLAGPALEFRAGHDIVSDGIALGAIQVPGDGQPLVLMADRQPTGGYPKIGTVIRADLPVLAQSRPGRAIGFRAVTLDQAVAALRRARPDAEALSRLLRPLSRGIDLGLLATGNHASGFHAAGQDEDDRP